MSPEHRVVLNYKNVKHEEAVVAVRDRFLSTVGGKGAHGRLHAGKSRHTTTTRGNIYFD
jgi:hypothetical protein